MQRRRYSAVPLRLITFQPFNGGGRTAILENLSHCVLAGAFRPIRHKKLSPKCFILCCAAVRSTSPDKRIYY